MSESPLISENYRDLNKKLHESDPGFGASSKKWVPMVAKIAEQNQFASILDYGAGKGDLAGGLNEYWAGAPVCEVISYDPARPGMETKKPCDLVVCTDVLEHIEPECLEAVLDDILAMTRGMAIVTVSTIPAEKCLADGRNAHLIQQDAKWWTDKIWSRFEVLRLERVGGDVRFVLAREVQLVKKKVKPDVALQAPQGIAFA